MENTWTDSRTGAGVTAPAAEKLDIHGEADVEPDESCALRTALELRRVHGVVALAHVVVEAEKSRSICRLQADPGKPVTPSPKAWEPGERTVSLPVWV